MNRKGKVFGWALLLVAPTLFAHELVVEHRGISGPVRMVEPLGDCPVPPLDTPLTIAPDGCYRKPRACMDVCEPTPFTVIEVRK